MQYSLLLKSAFSGQNLKKIWHQNNKIDWSSDTNLIITDNCRIKYYELYYLKLYFKQKAQLSPSDRAMRLVSSNLANYHATVQKLLIRQVLIKPMVWSWRISWRQCVINKATAVELCISPVYRRLSVAKFSKSTMSNCSRDPDHAHLGNTHHKTKTLHGRPVYKIWSL